MDKLSLLKDQKAIEAYEKAMKKSKPSTTKKEKNMKTKKAHKSEEKETKSKKEKKHTKKSKIKETKKHTKTKKEKKAKKERTKRVSKSGKFKSIRHMLETMFAKKQTLSKEEADKAVAKEFPQSGYAARLKKGGSHYPAYKTRIVSHCIFKTINPPKWAKKTRAKVK